METHVYTVNEVAELLKITPQSVYALRNKGKLPAVNDIGSVRFRVKDVHAFIGIEYEFTPYNFRQLQLENEKLVKENNELKQKIRKATSEMLLLVNGGL